MKEKMKRLWAATLAGFMGLSFAACGTPSAGTGGGSGSSGVNTYSYLAIDINPSIELVVNGETVVSVKACNDDAAVLLSGENLEDLSVEQATEKIVDLAEELGYLTEENDDVKLTVTADSDELAATLEGLVQKGVGKASEIAKFNTNPRLADELQLSKLKEKHGDKFKDLTAGKLRLIEAIMEYDETMTYELGVTLSVSELSETLDGYVEETADIVGEEMEELFESKYKELRREAYGRIAELYGEEYKAAWDRFVALEKVVKEIEKKAEALVITAEDVEELMGAFENLEAETEESEVTEESEETEETEEQADERSETIESLATSQTHENKGGHEEQNDKGHSMPEIMENGSLEMESFHRFFDRHEDCCFDSEKYEEIFDKVKEILERYDEEEYVLTEEDLAAIAEAWGETIDVTTFGDLEDFLEEQEEALEELRESIELDPMTEAFIRAMEEGMKSMRQTAKNLVQSYVEAAKADFQARKDALRGGKN